MYDINHSGYHILGEVMEMASRFPFYSNQKIAELRRKFLPPILYGKIRLYRNQQPLVGFATWAFLTRDESTKRTFGHDAFARNGG